MIIVRELCGILAFFAFWMGAVFASFLNVVIWRVPRGESIVSPPSHCPKCNAAIKWYQNVPILSWLVLRGKCANCRAPISPRYIFVETLGGLLFLAAFWKFLVVSPTQLAIGPYVTLIVYLIWISLMIVGSFIDFDLQLLPDFVTIGGMVLGVGYWLAVSLLAPGWSLQSFLPLGWSIGGLALGFGLLWLIRFFGSKAFGREAMGMGDVLLLGAVGALFGPVAVLVTLILSSVFGSVVGLTMIALSKTRLGKFATIPYGPYICMGCLVWMFFGPELVSWYLRLLNP